MEMMTTPLEWRKDWKLYRSTVHVDERGNERRAYPEEPDYTGRAGSTSGVCWQVKSAEWTLREFGEKAAGGATFDLFSGISIQPFDRCAFGGHLWEVRSVLPRSNHVHVALVEVRSL